MDDRGGAHRAVQQTVPQLVRTVHGVGERERSHVDIDEALVRQQGSELGGIGEPKEVGPAGTVSGGADADFAYGLQEYAHESCAIGKVPRSERQPSIVCQDTPEFRDGLFGTTEMRDGQIADYRVEGAILEGKRLCIGLLELGPWIPLSGKHDHRLGDVDSGRCRSPVGRPPRQVSWTTGDVEHPSARANVNGVEERIAEPTGQARPIVVVVDGLRLPTAASKALNAATSTTTVAPSPTAAGSARPEHVVAHPAILPPDHGAVTAELLGGTTGGYRAAQGV